MPSGVLELDIFLAIIALEGLDEAQGKYMTTISEANALCNARGLAIIKCEFVFTALNISLAWKITQRRQMFSPERGVHDIVTL